MKRAWVEFFDPFSEKGFIRTINGDWYGFHRSAGKKVAARAGSPGTNTKFRFVAHADRDPDEDDVVLFIPRERNGASALTSIPFAAPWGFEPPKITEKTERERREEKRSKHDEKQRRKRLRREERREDRLRRKQRQTAQAA